MVDIYYISEYRYIDAGYCYQFADGVSEILHFLSFLINYIRRLSSYKILQSSSSNSSKTFVKGKSLNDKKIIAKAILGKNQYTYLEIIKILLKQRNSRKQKMAVTLFCLKN